MASIKKKYLFVDGYNVINSWEKLKKIKDISLEEARERLISDLAQIKALEGYRVIVVFDAYNIKSIKERIYYDLGVKIVFTKLYQTADSYIEKEVDRLARRHEVIVCTDDYQIQILSLERGALRISSTELHNILESKKKLIKLRKRQDVLVNKDSYPVFADIIDKLQSLKDKLE